MSDDKRHLPVVGATDSPPGESPRAALSRRQFLRSAAGAVAVAALGGCKVELEGLFRAHFHELTRAEIDQILARLEKKYSNQFGKPVHVGCAPAQEGVSFGYGLDSRAASAAVAASTPASRRTTSL